MTSGSVVMLSLGLKPAGPPLAQTRLRRLLRLDRIGAWNTQLGGAARTMVRPMVQRASGTAMSAIRIVGRFIAYT